MHHARTTALEDSGVKIKGIVNAAMEGEFILRYDAELGDSRQ